MTAGAPSWAEKEEARRAAEAAEERETLLERERERRAAQRVLEAAGFDGKRFRVRVTLGSWGTLRGSSCQVVEFKRKGTTFPYERAWSRTVALGATFAAAVAVAIEDRRRADLERAERAVRDAAAALARQEWERRRANAIRAAAALDGDALLVALAGVAEEFGALQAEVIRSSRTALVLVPGEGCR